MGKYLAILMYRTDNSEDANYSFAKDIRFYSKPSQVNKKLEYFSQRLPRSGEGFQMKKNPPVEVLIFNENLKLIKKQRR